jgi:tetratricopeptide (TPR) repeat protein
MSKKNQPNRLKEWVANLSPRTKVITVTATLVVVVLGGLVVFLAILANQTKPTTGEPTADAAQLAKRDTSVLQSRRDGAVRDAAEKALESGNSSQANDVYKSAIAGETDTPRKVQLYVDQSGVLYAAGRYDEAFAAAKQAEAITDDKFLIADWLSRIYEDQKQYAVAAQYYTLAGQWAKSPTNKTALTKGYYDGEAARVAALAGKK